MIDRCRPRRIMCYGCPMSFGFQKGAREISEWVRNSVMMTSLLAWTAYVLAQMVRGQPVDAILWGVPGGIYFALNPTMPRRNGDRDRKDPRE